MIHVNIEGEHYISSLQRGKRWCRRKVPVERKAQASLAAEEKRGRRA
jgi:hypothetical protein